VLWLVLGLLSVTGVGAYLLPRALEGGALPA